MCITGREEQYISSSEEDETDHRTDDPDVSVSQITYLFWRRRTQKLL